MSVYVVQSSVRVGNVLQQLGDDLDAATLVCVAPRRILGWIRAARLSKANPKIELGHVKLAQVEVTTESGSSQSTIRAGDESVVVDWGTIRRTAADVPDRQARELAGVLERDAPGFESPPFTEEHPAIALVLLAGLAVLPPSRNPVTIKTCVECGTKRMPPRPPDDCGNPSACWLMTDV